MQIRTVFIVWISSDKSTDFDWNTIILIYRNFFQKTCNNIIHWKRPHILCFILLIIFVTTRTNIIFILCWTVPVVLGLSVSSLSLHVSSSCYLWGQSRVILLKPTSYKTQYILTWFISCTTLLRFIIARRISRLWSAESSSTYTACGCSSPSSLPVSDMDGSNCRDSGHANRIYKIRVRRIKKPLKKQLNKGRQIEPELLFCFPTITMLAPVLECMYKWEHILVRALYIGVVTSSKTSEEDRWLI